MIQNKLMWEIERKKRGYLHPDLFANIDNKKEKDENKLFKGINIVSQFTIVLNWLIIYIFFLSRIS